MDWRRGKPTQTKCRAGLMKYTASVMRTRKITVEAETRGRADTLIRRRMERGEYILSIQTSLL